MSITINGKIFQRLDSTANWDYTNPVLGLKENGYEVDNLTDRNPVGMKIGDGVSTWTDLPYWFDASSFVAPVLVKIPAGSVNPFPIDTATDYPQFGSVFRAQPLQLRPGTTNTMDLAGDIGAGFVVNLSDLAAGNINILSLLPYGHDDGTGHTLDDFWILLSK